MLNNEGTWHAVASFAVYVRFYVISNDRLLLIVRD